MFTKIVLPVDLTESTNRPYAAARLAEAGGGS